MLWKNVLGYEGLYQVSDCGEIRKVLDNGEFRLMHPVSITIGYKLIYLTKKKKTVPYYVHRLVAECFIGLPTSINPDGTEMRTSPEINHKDGNPSNNDYNNLEWCDRYYNNSHRMPSTLWNFQRKTNAEGRKPVEHSPEMLAKMIAVREHKIKELEEANEKLAQGLGNAFAVHSDKFLMKRIDKNISKIEHYKNEIERFL